MHNLRSKIYYDVPRFLPLYRTPIAPVPPRVGGERSLLFFFAPLRHVVRILSRVVVAVYKTSRGKTLLTVWGDAILYDYDGVWTTTRRGRPRWR